MISYIKNMGDFKPIGPYSFAARLGNHIFTSGHLGVDIQTGRLVEGGIKMQARQALLNLSLVVEQAGGNLQNALAITVYITDMEHDYKELNEVFEEIFREGFPPRSTIQVSALPMGAVVEISAIVGVV